MQQATIDKLTIIATIVPVLQELRHSYGLIHTSHKEALDMLPRKTIDDAEIWLHGWREGMKQLNGVSDHIHHLAGVVSGLTEDILVETGYQDEDDYNGVDKPPE